MQYYIDPIQDMSRELVKALCLQFNSDVIKLQNSVAFYHTSTVSNVTYFKSDSDLEQTVQENAIILVRFYLLYTWEKVSVQEGDKQTHNSVEFMKCLNYNPNQIIEEETNSDKLDRIKKYVAEKRLDMAQYIQEKLCSDKFIELYKSSIKNSIKIDEEVISQITEALRLEALSQFGVDKVIQLFTP